MTCLNSGTYPKKAIYNIIYYVKLVLRDLQMYVARPVSMPYTNFDFPVDNSTILWVF